MIKSNKGRWYVKQGEKVQGPFPNKLIGRFLILGRITQQTLVSQDQINWSEVAKYPAMVPDVVKDAGTPQGDRALMLARIREDERSSEVKSGQELDNRREDEEQVMQLHRQIRDDVMKSYVVHSHKQRVYFVIAGLLALILLLLGFLITQTDQSARLVDCNAPASMGINWSGCNKQGEVLRGKNLKKVIFRSAKLQGADFSESQMQQADLAYADLSQATMVSSQLQNANLKGANLHYSNLMNADLSGADLSYAELVGSQLQGANLTGALFDDAIWVNGEKCLPGSVGACLLPLSE